MCDQEDPYGNMTCQQNQQTQGLCPQYGFNTSTNQINNSGYSYDAAGAVAPVSSPANSGDGDIAATEKYDAEGRLISVDGGRTASYVYNAEGQCVEKGMSNGYVEYLFDSDGNPIGKNNRTSWTDTWVTFNGRHIAHFENGVTGPTYFIHADRIGTANIVTDYATGSVVQDELHYPWGQEWTMSGSMEEERFAGMQHRDGETTLDPTQNRMYSSDSGRWLTPDPAQADVYNPQSMSRYAYVLNNPTIFVDPLGLGCQVVGTRIHCTSTGTYPTGSAGESLGGGIGECPFFGCVPNCSIFTCGPAPGLPSGGFGGGGSPAIGPAPRPAIGPAPPRPAPPVVKPTPPPPQPVHSGSYGDYLKCVADEFIILGIGNRGRAATTVLLNVGGVALLGTGPGAAVGGLAAAYDLKIEFLARETCMEEVYGHP